MSFVYDEACRMAASGELDWDGAAANSFRLILVMDTTTADTQKSANTMADFTTLGEYVGTNYTSGGEALDTLGITEDAGSNEAELTAMAAGEVTWTSLGAAANNCQAAIVVYDPTPPSSPIAEMVPIAYLDGTGFPFNGNGNDVTVQFAAEGVLKFTAVP